MKLLKLVKTTILKYCIEILIVEIKYYSGTTMSD